MKGAVECLSKRKDTELPRVIAKEGWRFHHIGIPTEQKRDGETYIKHLKMYVSGFDSSPYGIEWMRFEPDSPVSRWVRELPHLAFVVDDLEAALDDKRIISEISNPSPGVRVAMILDDGAPVELIEFATDASDE